MCGNTPQSSPAPYWNTGLVALVVLDLAAGRLIEQQSDSGQRKRPEIRNVHRCHPVSADLVRVRRHWLRSYRLYYS